MPVYEFTCEDPCPGRAQDLFPRVIMDGDPEPVMKCPVCGKPMKRAISGGSFKFAGFGKSIEA